MYLALTVCLQLLGLSLGSTKTTNTTRLCELYNYLGSQTVALMNSNLVNMNYLYSSPDQLTYFSLCDSLDESIPAALGLEDDYYVFISCRNGSACFGIKTTDIIDITPRLVNKERKLYIYDIFLSDPVDKIPIVLSFPNYQDFGNNSGGDPNATVVYHRVSNSPVEYMPINCHNYSIAAPTEAILATDIYLFGTRNYLTSWAFAVVSGSFMLTSVCFHNFISLSGKMSSFCFFINFYILYRLIDLLFGTIYTPDPIIATISVILVPVAFGYVLSFLDRSKTYYGTFCSLLLTQTCTH